MTASPHGVLGQFDSPEALLQAVMQARAAGFAGITAHSPFAIDGMSEALGRRRSALIWWVLAGALLGALGGFALQVYSAVWDYPINVGGRPMFSWPAFIPISAELTFAGAALFGFVALLRGSGLPRLYHPLFSAPMFEAASRDGFFLCIAADDGSFDAKSAARLLRRAGAQEVVTVDA